MSAFLAEDPPCLALGMVEEGASRCALLAQHAASRPGAAAAGLRRRLQLRACVVW
jgi:hypothetical protein